MDVYMKNGTIFRHLAIILGGITKSWYYYYIVFNKYDIIIVFYK